MHSVFCYGYTVAGVGFCVSVIYLGLFNICQQRNLRMVLENATFQQFYEGIRHHTLAQRYFNRYRTKQITRRILHKINQLTPRVHLLTEWPRWKLIYTSGGDIRAIPMPA
ncbi:uncharacterized protein LOC126563387 [Anopheles maculipalpis]|uniref:uncharacterized protein LOC126563387 n=1 Tax=Anopheles maculipalpis TaxID=1496333 RepID=UPI0021594559|nr:uncharacterized protein LOC126563387 [Anopheles maculipalpis]